jgi:hypothetical protein
MVVSQGIMIVTVDVWGVKSFAHHNLDSSGAGAGKRLSDIDRKMWPQKGDGGLAA